MTKISDRRLANTAYFLIIFLILGYLLYIGKAVIVPIIFGIILSFLLYPICRKLESWKFPRILAILTSMLAVTVLIAGVLTLFSSQFLNLFDDLENFKSKIYDTLQQALDMLAQIPFLEKHAESLLKEGGAGVLNNVSNFLGSTLVTSTAFIGYLGMVAVYVFLFLLYRSAFKNFILSFYPDPHKREEVSGMLYRFQRVTQSYFGGLLIAILILGTINTLGLFLIGIDHAFLFGFFAACLTIIPYIGTTLGGTLPFLYALLNYDELWRPIAVVVMYQLVQTIEGNYITPKIVGSQVSINPLVAIVVLIIGGFYWGIAGMVLSLPLTALTKILLENMDSTRHFAYLLSNDFAPEKNTLRKTRKSIEERKTEE